MAEAAPSSPNSGNKLDKVQVEALLFSMKPLPRGSRNVGAVIPFNDHVLKHPEILFKFHIEKPTGKIEIRGPEREYLDAESEEQGISILKKFIASLPTPPSSESLVDETEEMSRGPAVPIVQKSGVRDKLRNWLRWN